jgi:hypothetical protein
VYAVPLVLIRYADGLNLRDDPPTPPIMSEPRSASHLWRRLVQNPAAVVFDAPASAWPAELFLLAKAGIHRSVQATAREIGLELEREPPADLSSGSIKGDLRLVVPNGKTLGLVLKPFLARVDRLDYYEMLTAIEVVFRQPIPPRCIRKVVQRYETGRAWKSRAGQRSAEKRDSDEVA